MEPGPMRRKSPVFSEATPRAFSPLGIVIADDLSGACDAGVQFSRKGLLTRVILSASAKLEGVEVPVLTTNSRRDTPAVAAKRTENVVNALPAVHSAMCFKKIDSTLRGNIVCECESLMRIMGLCCAVIAPAYPTNGRIVEDGILKYHEDGREQHCDALDLFRMQGVERLVHIRTSNFPAEESLTQELRRLRASGARYILCDAATTRELERIARAIYATSERTLWIGSAGLAEQAAQVLAEQAGVQKKSSVEQPLAGARRGPVLLCVGSDHPATLKQVELLRRVGGVARFEAESCDPKQVNEAIEERKDVLLLMDTSRIDAKHLYGIFELTVRAGIAGMIVTGGDTAWSVSEISGAETIQPQGEFATGIPWGYVGGGLFEGLPVITKSGGFGTEVTLRDAAGFLGGLRRQ